jgi:hypothetical protein
MRSGHQWKRVVERIKSGRRWSAAQRANWTSSRSSRVAKCRLTKQVLVRGHRAQEMLSRLEFGRVRRQEQEMNMLGHPQLEAGMPARAIKHQDNLLRRARADGLGKGGEFHLEERDAHCGGQVEDGAA